MIIATETTSPDLTTDEAAGLAKRWAYWLEWKPWLASPTLEEVANEGARAEKLPRLTATETESLLIWVRHCVVDNNRDGLAAELWLTHEQAVALATAAVFPGDPS